MWCLQRLGASSTRASFMCALLPEHLTVSYTWQHRLPGKPHWLITLGTKLYSYSHFELKFRSIALGHNSKDLKQTNYWKLQAF